MRVTQHISNNDVLRAPAGDTVDVCRPAPITRTVYSDGTQSVATFWQPSDTDRLSIAAGGLVRVEVLGHTMPPMSVEVSAPKEQP